MLGRVSRAVCIVVTAGMVSTTYVQFLKGSLLVLFSAGLTVLILQRGLRVDSRYLAGGNPFAETQRVTTGPGTPKLVNFLVGWACLMGRYKSRDFIDAVVNRAASLLPCAASNPC